MARTADKTDIPRRLTAAGHELFTRCGYHATGIQQITDQAGVPKGSFYNHFDSKEAFAADYSLVETMAHFGAAQHFAPDVDFIIDIGGQDMKCFKIRGGAVVRRPAAGISRRERFFGSEPLVYATALLGISW